MAKCEKCGKEYYTRECLNCRDNQYKRTLNSNNKVDGSKYNPSSNKTNSSNNMKIIIPSVLAVVTIIVITIFNMTSNPLIGKWSTGQKAIMGMQLGKMEFTKNKMMMMGIVSKVDYEIDGDTIYVTDETGTGMIFKMINNNTMYSEMMGMRSKYKKIN